MKIHAMGLGASALALACASSATAAETAATTAAAARSANTTSLEELVVTAERRVENLQSTAIAATVLTGDDLTRKGVFTVDQLQFIAPSLTVNNFGQGNDFNIRGIGKGEHNTQTSTGVVTYRDGAATFPGYLQEEPYFDIASVEVLRGPQGTFSGQNATGGAVIVNTNDPKIGGGHSGYLLAHYGNYNDLGVQGAVNLPISDTLAARVAVYTQYRDTFYHITGPWTGNPNLYWGAARLSLLWTPTPKLKLLWKTDYDYLDNGGYFGDPITSPDTSTLFHFANNYETYAVDQFVRSTLKADYVADSGITFRSISSYQRGRSGWKGDIDGTANAAPNYIIAEAVNEQLLSQEVNVISPDTGPFKWVLGAYYQNNRYYFPVGRFLIGVPPGVVDERLDGINKTYTWALFGQATFELPHNFELQLGLRYSKWSTINHVRWFVPQFPVLDFADNEQEVGYNLTGKATLNWQLNASNFLYAFVATGAKPGGLNGALYFGGGIVPPPFRQEYVWDYEVGWKSSLMDNHLRTQIGAYYSRFQHFQVILPIPNNPLQSTEQNNPNPSKIYGVEATAQAVFGGLSLDAGIGVSKSEIGTFYTQDPRLPRSGPCDPMTGPVSASCINLGGNPQTYAPGLTFNASASYRFQLPGGDTLTPGVSFSHIGHQWGTLFDNRAAGDYLAARNLLGATLAWSHGDLVATLYGYNLTDDHYVAALLSPIRMAGPPLQVGISVMKTF
ncbi:MAG TPA: TonB-dependent receptor [Caulobacteraceae bacterium]|nr:TonB-dependent receptor [Caulobacteraceae bacterium]